MKKILSILMIFLTISSGFIFADSSEDPFDKLVDKLLAGVSEEEVSIAVKVFNSDLSNAERKQISKSVQFSFYCAEGVEIVSNTENADYVCKGKIETDGANYILTAKLEDEYGDVVSKAKQKVSKKYYAGSKSTDEITTSTVIIENDDSDVLGALIAGAIIGGVVTELATPPSPRPRPRRAAPRPAPRPSRPARPAPRPRR